MNKLNLGKLPLRLPILFMAFLFLISSVIDHGSISGYVMSGLIFIVNLILALAFLKQNIIWMFMLSFVVILFYNPLFYSNYFVGLDGSVTEMFISVLYFLSTLFWKKIQEVHH